MAPRRIPLIPLKTQTVRWHAVDAILWDKVWTNTHIRDVGEETTIPLKGISWKSTSSSSESRFGAMFEKTRQIVEPRSAQYVWIDAACFITRVTVQRLERSEFHSWGPYTPRGLALSPLGCCHPRTDWCRSYPHMMAPGKLVCAIGSSECARSIRSFSCLKCYSSFPEIIFWHETKSISPS